LVPQVIPGSIRKPEVPIVDSQAERQGRPWISGAVGVAIVADPVGSQPPILGHQIERGKEKGPNLLVTGLTGLSLAAATEFGSASAGADLLSGSE
jgi:hypothetical protein